MSSGSDYTFSSQRENVFVRKMTLPTRRSKESDYVSLLHEDRGHSITRAAAIQLFKGEDKKVV
jgi:hypothetical protein